MDEFKYVMYATGGCEFRNLANSLLKYNGSIKVLKEHGTDFYQVEYTFTAKEDLDNFYSEL